ncbi:hypothetical protein JKP88DRAFT_324405 [Tribonema minus]|uniref:Uncharacterized protein n=1 Tax=Tribonema minus TaxID=303371 RepID=A0A835YRN2_9STRA|nr:hypothetical protein JKP88DRAFT_324405 [Tribonema minus]
MHKQYGNSTAGRRRAAASSNVVAASCCSIAAIDLPTLPQLTTLNLAYNPVDEQTLGQLISACPNATSLDLTWSHLSDPWTAADRLRALAALRVLGIQGSPLTLTRQWRPHMLQRVPQLRALDGAVIDSPGRNSYSETDSEPLPNAMALRVHVAGITLELPAVPDAKAGKGAAKSGGAAPAAAAAKGKAEKGKGGKEKEAPKKANKEAEAKHADAKPMAAGAAAAAADVPAVHPSLDGKRWQLQYRWCLAMTPAEAARARAAAGAAAAAAAAAAASAAGAATDTGGAAHAMQWQCSRSVALLSTDISLAESAQHMARVGPMLRNGLRWGHFAWQLVELPAAEVDSGSAADGSSNRLECERRGAAARVLGGGELALHELSALGAREREVHGQVDWLTTSAALSIGADHKPLLHSQISCWRYRLPLRLRAMMETIQEKVEAAKAKLESRDRAGSSSSSSSSDDDEGLPATLEALVHPAKASPPAPEDKLGESAAPIASVTGEEQPTVTASGAEETKSDDCNFCVVC